MIIPYLDARTTGSTMAEMRGPFVAFLVVVVGTLGTLVLERSMSNAPEWIWRVAYSVVVVGGLAIALLSNPVFGILSDFRIHPALSTAISTTGVAMAFAAFWLFWVVGFPSSKVYLASNAKKDTLRWEQAFDKLDKRDAYVTRVFSLSREKGETISLGPCPGEKCLEIRLGELVNTQEGLEQEIIIKGDIGVKFNPEPSLLFQTDAIIEGARLVPGAEHSSAWFLLRQGGGFSLTTHRADIIFSVVDLQADNLKIKLEIKPSSLIERRKDRHRQHGGQGLIGLQLREECDEWIESGKALYERLGNPNIQKEAITEAPKWLNDFQQFVRKNFPTISDYDRLTYFRNWGDASPRDDLASAARHYQRSLSYCYGNLALLRNKIT